MLKKLQNMDLQAWWEDAECLPLLMPYQIFEILLPETKNLWLPLPKAEVSMTLQQIVAVAELAYEEYVAAQRPKRA